MANKMTVQEKIELMRSRARASELTNFILAVKNGQMITFHFEQVVMQDAMQIMISGFHHVINMELERHPEYSKEYREIYAGLAKGFNDLVRSADQKFKDFKKK